MKSLIYFVIISALFYSCSTYKIADKHVSKAFTKGGLELKELKTDNYNIKYWDSNNDKPILVLLHGFGTPARFQWFNQVKILSKDYRVIFPNLIYFGGSTSCKEDFTVDNQVKAMEALITHLNIDTFYLGGVSYGGLVAAELAIKNEEKINKLIIIDSPIKYLKEEDLKKICDIYGCDDFVDLLMPSEYENLRDIISIAFKKPPYVPAFILKDAHKNLYTTNVEEKKNLLRHLEENRKEFASTVYNFSCPVLFVWGENDILIPVTICKQLTEHVGVNSKLEIIPETAHMPNLEKPKEFNKILIDFLIE